MGIFKKKGVKLVYKKTFEDQLFFFKNNKIPQDPENKLGAKNYLNFFFVEFEFSFTNNFTFF